MPLNLEKYLILNKYFLYLLGYDDCNKLREDFSEINLGYDSTGRSYIVNTLIGKSTKINEQILLNYDEIIKDYEQRLKTNRNESQLNLKYFQYFAVLFTEYFFELLSTNKESLLIDLNSFSVEYCQMVEIPPLQFTEQDLKKLAYWMATGSGKTLLMHINYWQILKYLPDWENIILITPNQGLSKQHYDEYQLSGIPAKPYTGSEESLKTKEGEVLIIEITKLTEEKTGEGLSVDVSYFSEDKNLVFIDEGHKGQRSEEQIWKKLREAIGKKGFIFEYSATFGQVINQQRTLLLEEYQKAIIFDYSYKYFYTDGYGKDFYTYNIAEDEYSDEQIELLLTASLLSYYEQLVLFEKYPELSEEYNIEKPLWIFVGSKVIGKKITKEGEKSISDVILITHYLRSIISKPEKLNKNVKKILNDNSNLADSDGNDIFANKFHYLKNHIPQAEDIYNKVFNGTGTLELYENKTAEGEIALRTSLGKDYFGVINIGDVSALKKKMQDERIEVKVENIKESQFDAIKDSNSSIKILIGSKKFIEGWNSWRVSNMGLMNIGRSEGTQIIQLFGRGIRLKGKNLSLKREEPAAIELKTLQTLSIFGLNADYVSAFLDNIENEVELPKEYEIKIEFNQKDKWENKIFTFRKDDNYDLKDQLIELKYKKALAKRVTIDLRPKITIISGFELDRAQSSEETYSNPLIHPLYSKFINWNDLILTLNIYKIARGFYNLVYDKKILQDIIMNGDYKIYIIDSQLPNDFTIKDKIQRLAELVLKEYLYKFYTDSEKDYLTKHLKIEKLNSKSHKELFPNDNSIILKVPKEYVSEIDKLVNEINKFHSENIERIPTIHFDKHLYSPLAVYKKGKKYEEIKTVPVKLNEGETKFIHHLREYLFSKANDLKDIEVFILRNISKKGLGFFVETSSFYPDFILWIKRKNKQDIIFIDPKGILLLGNVNDEKVRFCNETIKEIETALKKQLEEKRNKIELNLHAYIISVTAYDTVKPKFGEGNMSKEDFEKSNILFLEDDKAYIEKIFAGKIKNLNLENFK